MDEPDSRASVLLVAGLVALATVPAAPLHAGTADAVSGDSLGAVPESVDTDSFAQETTDNADNETSAPGDGAVDNHTAEPLAFPERPASLNESSVQRYVAAYEQVRKHNDILEVTTDVSITSTDVRCSPRSLDEQTDGFAVEVVCGFSYEFGQNGTPTGIADGAPYFARYLVGENATELRGLWSALGGGAAQPLPAPTKPERLTDVSAAAFAADYEEVRRYNRIRNETNATVTRADVLCELDRLTERDGEFVVDVACDFSYDFRTGDGAVGVADGAPYTARYRITEAETELVRVTVVGENATTPTGAETAAPVEETTTTAEG